MQICPKCKGKLAPATEGASYLKCDDCRGLWMAEKLLRSFLARCCSHGSSRAPLVLLEMPPTPTSLVCPECLHDLDRTRFRGVDVERCPSCRGMFLDDGELRNLSERVIHSAAAYDRLMTSPSEESTGPDLPRSLAPGEPHADS